jgi:isopenicillin N synthase-like dioxygenase
MAADIAVVSFERFLKGDEKGKREVAADIYDAFSTVGWVYIKDHGVDGVENAFRLVSVNNAFGSVVLHTDLSIGKTVLRTTS